MDAREYLEGLRKIMAEKTMWERELGRIDDMLGAKAIQYQPDRVQTSPRQDGLENEAIRYTERREKIIRKLNETITELMEKQFEALTYIKQIESDDQREVLILRYIDGLKWWDIMSARRCDDISGQMKLRDRAISSLQKIMDDYTMSI